MTKPNQLARAVGLALLGLSVIAAVLAFFPGVDVYNQHSDGWMDYRTSETVGSPLVGILALAAWPAVRAARWRWTLLVCAGVLATVTATFVWVYFHLDFDFYTREYRVAGSVATLALLLIVGISALAPIVAAVDVLVRRRRHGAEAVPVG
jgi:hypothetical protein